VQVIATCLRRTFWRTYLDVAQNVCLYKSAHIDSVEGVHSQDHHEKNFLFEIEKRMELSNPLEKVVQPALGIEHSNRLYTRFSQDLWKAWRIVVERKRRLTNWWYWMA